MIYVPSGMLDRMRMYNLQLHAITQMNFTKKILFKERLRAPSSQKIVHTKLFNLFAIYKSRQTSQFYEKWLIFRMGRIKIEVKMHEVLR